MPTVVNEMTLEPKTAPPPETAAGPASTAAVRSGPEIEREIEKVKRREHERALRVWAY
ncbi:MAG: hypothetical protein ABR517_03665 [Thermoanaerobaculia bacterium]